MPRSAPEAQAAAVALQPGQRLFSEGEHGSTVYFVEAGQLELLKRQGAEEVRLGLLEAGEPVGEAQALDGGPRSFSVRAVLASQLLAVEADTLLALLGAHPDVAVAMLRRLAPRLEAALLARLPPDAARGPAAAARLVHPESGREFPLPAGDEVRVGRADARSPSLPDLDLSAIDPTRSLSRRHARIVREALAFLVFEEPRVANGTFLNGAKLPPEKRVPLKPGDELRLGVVDLIFRAG
jgi:CRP-like cAMP-binding protein